MGRINKDELHNFSRLVPRDGIEMIRLTRKTYIKYSMTKAVAVVAALRLVEKNMILDEPLDDILPEMSV